MKKTYTKPYLAVESFQLDAAVAGSCTNENKISMNSGVENCNLATFNAGITQFGPACVTNVLLTYGDYNTFCYHGPQIDLTAIALQS